MKTYCFINIVQEYIFLIILQENKISVWSVGDFSGLALNGEYHGEPHLLCDIQHSGDVMDMQVKIV